MFYFLDEPVEPFYAYKNSFNNSTVIGAIAIAVTLVILVAIILAVKLRKEKINNEIFRHSTLSTSSN